MHSLKHTFLLFGATGAIGTSIRLSALARGWDVTSVARSIPEQSSDNSQWVRMDPLAADFTVETLAQHGPFAAVCWAQGANTNDSIYTVDLAQHMELYQANCIYILATLKALLDNDLLIRPSRLCIISSIWQNIARQNKLSYSMTKAALRGLVLSASTDLGADGHLLNAVLPGAIDTPMTRSNLTATQLDKLSAATKFNKLSSLADVTSLVMYLCSPDNTGITGQFISADLGFSNVHLL